MRRKPSRLSVALYLVPKGRILVAAKDSNGDVVENLSWKTDVILDTSNSRYVAPSSH